MLNPVRVAEEIAMLDIMSKGPLVAGMLRGTPNENVTYNMNPSESRARFEEAFQINSPSLDREPAVRLARSLFLLSRHIGVAAPGAAAASADLYVRNEPQIRLVRGAATGEPSAGGHHLAARHRGGETLSRGSSQWAGNRNRPIFFIGSVFMSRIATNKRWRISRRAMRGANAAVQSWPIRHWRRRLRGPTITAGTTPTSERAIAVPRRWRIASNSAGMIGGPATVVAQANRIRRQLGAGIFDLIPAFELGERTLHSLELYARKVLPELRD